MDKQTIFISADHGLAIVYFLQSEVVPTLLNAGHRVILLTDDALKESLKGRFGRQNLEIEGLRLQEANAYYATQAPETQWWLNFSAGWAVRTGSIRRQWTAMFVK